MSITTRFMTGLTPFFGGLCLLGLTVLVGCYSGDDSDGDTDTMEDTDPSVPADPNSPGTAAAETTDAEPPDGADGSTSGSDEDSSGTAATDPEAEVVEFRIRAGTGASPWNTADDPLIVYVGQRLRIYNDDDQGHTLHASGVPVDHGEQILPGQYQDTLVLEPYEPTDRPTTWDHDAGEAAPFWLLALP